MESTLDGNFRTVQERFPAIAKKLRVFWGYPEFVALMHDLQQDTSDRPRIGFPADVLMALLALELAHDAQYPELVLQDRSVWGVRAD